MSSQSDRLYDLLPVVYRQRDTALDHPLRDLLRVIAEQVNVLEEDITRLYENWFVETCDDWVVPYIGDLVGYRQVHEAGEPGDVTTPQERRRNKILIPRREVANTLHYRRRKGTLSLLETLAEQVAGWPARAVEFYRLLAWTQSLNHLRLDPTQRGGTVDLRQGDALDRLGGPFDELAHTVDVRRIDRSPTHVLRGGGQGVGYNLPSVGVFVWRLRAYPVTQGQAPSLEDVAEAGPHCYTFSFLGNDTPLFVRPQPEPEPTTIAGEANLPVPIRRRAFDRDPGRFYGEGKSIQIWRDSKTGGPIPPERIVAADLSQWHHVPSGGRVAVDPVLGRIMFDPDDSPDQVFVSYHYGFSADVGGGEYDRPISPVAPSGPPDFPVFFQVHGPEGSDDRPIHDALAAWQAIRAEHPHAVIELMDSSEYPEQLDIRLEAGQSLQIRAANRRRPTVFLADRTKGRPDFLKISGKDGGRLILDGLLITGRGVRVKGTLDGLCIRHCTLVPGQRLYPRVAGGRRTTAGPSLYLDKAVVPVTIEHSIVGPIRVDQDQVTAEPLPVSISDSIVDATDAESEALAGGGGAWAHASLTIARSTAIGRVRVHAIELAEDCIFVGLVQVARRQVGCMRFCYASLDCRTPRRFHCQPDLAIKRAREMIEAEPATDPAALREEIRAAEDHAAERVRPLFNSVHYTAPTYCQLAADCPGEIARGASDGSEMGVFHDLFQPQRAANLRARLEEYLPAGMDAGLIYAS